MSHGSNRVLPLPQGKPRETGRRKAIGACFRICQPAAKGNKDLRCKLQMEVKNVLKIITWIGFIPLKL